MIWLLRDSHFATSFARGLSVSILMSMLTKFSNLSGGLSNWKKNSFIGKADVLLKESAGHYFFGHANLVPGSDLFRPKMLTSHYMPSGSKQRDFTLSNNATHIPLSTEVQPHNKPTNQVPCSFSNFIQDCSQNRDAPSHLTLNSKIQLRTSPVH